MEEVSGKMEDVVEIIEVRKGCQCAGCHREALERRSAELKQVIAQHGQ